MSVAWQLQDFENQVLLAIREMDALNFGGVPNFGQQFNKTLIDQTINQAVADTVMMAGFQPRLTDRIVSVATSTAVDFPLPVDCIGLQRIDYQQAPTINTHVTSGGFGPGVATVTMASMLNIAVGTQLIWDTAGSGVQETNQVTAITGTTVTATFVNAHGANCSAQSGPLQPYRLVQKVPDDFDASAGTGVWPTAVMMLGLPRVFREPIANAVRFYPQIGAIQVANGDQLIFTFTSYGLQMTANTDTCLIPVEFQRAIVFESAHNLWPMKADDDQADRYERRWKDWCNEARKRRWNLPQAGTFGFIEEDSSSWAYDSDTQW